MVQGIRCGKPGIIRLKMTYCDIDPWLSEMLGKPSYHVRSSFSQDISELDLPLAESFVDARVDQWDTRTLMDLQAVGFRVMDCNVNLVRDAVSFSINPHKAQNIRFAVGRDHEKVRALALASFRHNRFHRDPQIPSSAASRIKEIWASNFFNGKRGEWMVVAELVNGDIGGFLQLYLDDAKKLVVDLIAVSPSHKRLGLASQMISFAWRECGNNISGMAVGTQLSNIESFQLYQKLGFKLREASYSLHLHVDH